MTEPADLRQTIERAIREVLACSGRNCKLLRSGDALRADIGLDSLDLAQVVVLLEERLGVDPFRVGGEPVRTLDDLEHAYQRLVT